VAANHYEVRVEGGPLAELLAGRFGINLDNGDAEAMETMQRDAQGQIDDRNPNLGAVLSPEELKGAMKLAQEYEERQRQVSTPQLQSWCLRRMGRFLRPRYLYFVE